MSDPTDQKKMVIVREEQHEADARIVTGFLQSQGIEALISEDDAGDQLPSLESVGGVQIHVSVDDAQRAHELLAQLDAQQEAEEGSSDEG
ncbi:MAG: DUF2007 domain-containing protein [bacterium]|nr:DUF2007 domain-containing protein [bacterium]